MLVKLCLRYIERWFPRAAGTAWMVVLTAAWLLELHRRHHAHRRLDRAWQTLRQTETPSRSRNGERT